MSLLNLTPPSIGQPNATEDVDTVNAFNAIQTWANGNIDEQNITGATVQRLGLNNSGNVGRGKSIIGTTGTRTNVAFGALSDGPDQVAGVVLPADGLIAVAFNATWQSSASNAGGAAIFIGANQLKAPVINAAAPAAVEAGSAGLANIDFPLGTYSAGLATGNNSTGGNYAGDVTTGQPVGTVAPTVVNPAGNGITALGAGPCWIFAAAGTYTVSIQVRASSGSVTVKNRKLWVWTVGF